MTPSIWRSSAKVVGDTSTSWQIDRINVACSAVYPKLSTPRNIKGVLVWMDLEMTGLDHMSDVIVGATIITDDELNIIAEGLIW